MLDVFMVTDPSFGYWWLIAAVIFLLLEVGTPGLFFFISLSIGSTVAAILAFMGYSLMAQCISALLGCCIGLPLLTIVARKRRKDTAKTNIDALIGQEATVTVTISPHGIGRVKVRGEEWPAITTRQSAIQPSSRVTIVAIDGNKLIVN